MQGEEREAAELMRELLHRSVRLGLYEAMASEVDALCGPKHRPDPQCECRRAGSERGIAYLDGAKDEIVRPRVREKEGAEVRLATYEAASSPQGLFEQVVAAVAQGLPVRGVERATVSRLIGQWSEAGQIVEERHPFDGRRRILGFSVEAERLNREWVSALLEIFARMEVCES